MGRQAKWLWLVTGANLAVAILLILMLYAVRLALAAMAPEITTWPLLVALLVGFPLAIFGLLIARRVSSRISRYAAYLFNGCVLLMYGSLTLGGAMLFARTVNESFFIPDGYRGDVYVIYGSQNCEPLVEKDGEITYRIPGDGILRVCGTLDRKTTRTRYYYWRRDGSSQRIKSLWLTTIERTPENLADDSEVGVFFPRTGSSGTFASTPPSVSRQCSVDFQQFYVGTKHHLITNYRKTDLHAYLRDHPVGCKGSE